MFNPTSLIIIALLLYDYFDNYLAKITFFLCRPDIMSYFIYKQYHLIQLNGANYFNHFNCPLNK